MARTALGCAAYGGIVYSWFANGSDTYMYRQNQYTGEVIDDNPWLDSSGVLLTWIDESISFNTQMAIGKNQIGIVSQDDTNGIQIRLISRTAGTTTATTVINASTTAQCTDICADASDNFYVVWQIPAGNRRLSKYNSSGVLGWTLTGSTQIYGCAFDRIRSKLQVVGSALGGGANSVADIDPTDGSLDDGAAVASATWTSIAYDGRMGWLLGKADTIARITGDGEYTVTWTRTLTGFSGYKLAGADGSQGAGELQTSTRSVRLVGVSDGTVTCFDRHGLIPVTSGSSALSTLRPVVFAVQNGPRLYFADGVNTKRYNPLTNTMESWTASAGSFPVANTTDYPRLIENFRGRIWLAGIASDPDNWFMSAQNGPTDFDYTLTTDQAAVAGTNTDGCGKPPDIINCIFTYSDDLGLMGCDHSIFRVNGDPRRGSLDVVSTSIGMAWGRPICKDPYGAIYFMSSRGPVYRMSPGGFPELLSAAIDNILDDIDLAHTIVRMAWDDAHGGFYMTLTPLSVNRSTSHFYWDQRTGGWFRDRFRKAGHNPRCVYLYDGDQADDRVLLMGCNDGYVRYFDDMAADDDGLPISSYCFLGPLQNQGGGILLKELRFTLSDTSGKLKWAVHAGHSASDALASNATADGTLAARRNHVTPCRRHGHAVYVKVYQDEADYSWHLERLEAVAQGTGRVRGRTFS